MTLLLIQFLLSFFIDQPKTEEFDYTFRFSKIDNMVQITVNDDLVYTSGVVDHNPDLDGAYSVYISKYLTSGEDKVIIRLFNGYEPYNTQDDKHWELEYQLLKDGKEYEYVWEYADDNKLGLVFEETYYL